MKLISVFCLISAISWAFNGQALANSSSKESDRWFAKDKAWHFGVSFGLASGGYAVGALVSEKRTIRLGIGAGIALSAGVAKELWDLSGHGSPSWKDLCWDVVGTGVGLAFSWTIDQAITDSTRETKTAPAEKFSAFSFPKPQAIR